jgi:hypothetical protein
LDVQGERENTSGFASQEGVEVIGWLFGYRICASRLQLSFSALRDCQNSLAQPASLKASASLYFQLANSFKHNGRRRRKEKPKAQGFCV